MNVEELRERVETWAGVRTEVVYHLPIEENDLEGWHLHTYGEGLDGRAYEVQTIITKSFLPQMSTEMLDQVRRIIQNTLFYKIKPIEQRRPQAGLGL